MNAPEGFDMMITLRCRDCGERSSLKYGQSPDKWRGEHIQKHQRGRCDKCHHWNDEHRDATTIPDPLPGWRKTERVCLRPFGMGDFCGCGIELDE